MSSSVEWGQCPPEEVVRSAWQSAGREGARTHWPLVLQGLSLALPGKLAQDADGKNHTTSHYLTEF